MLEGEGAQPLVGEAKDNFYTGWPFPSKHYLLASLQQPKRLQFSK